MSKSNIVILTPEMPATMGVRAVADPCRLDFPSKMKSWMLPGQRHMGLTTMRVLAVVVEPWRLELTRCIWLNVPLMATNCPMPTPCRKWMFY